MYVCIYVYVSMMLCMSAHYDQGVVLLTYMEERRHVSVCMYCTYECSFLLLADYYALWIYVR
jgi:hypothetical protein